MTRRIAALLLLLAPLAVHSGAPARAADTRPVTARPAAARRAPAKPAARAAEPRLVLSWKAPFGTPGAASAIEAGCGDTTVVDTLYLSFDPGKDAPDFRGASANLYFHAQEGATLGDYWKQGGGGVNGAPLRVIFESDEDRGFMTPWNSQGAGAPFYDFVGGSGRLRIIYAIAGGSPVRAGKLYGLARVLVRRAAEGTSGCGAPMCVEWHSAMFAYSVGEERGVNKGDRWVSLNSPGGKVCESSRGVAGVKTWRPGQK
ncbi:MAG: hypothetical protein ABIS67_13705 [Candidatus Eisenbacteria bacterium]